MDQVSTVARPAARARELVARTAALALPLTLLVMLGAPPRAVAAHHRTFAAEAAAPAPRTAGQKVILAEDHGLMLVGKLNAVRSTTTPELRDVGEAAAEAKAPLPRANVFFRGAACRWTGKLRSAATLTFRLPKAIFTGTRLPLYRLTGHVWQRLRRGAVVGSVDSTASTTITRSGTYALLLTRAWKVVEHDGFKLVMYAGPIPRTVIRDPRIVASGTVDDPAVIAAVMTATGSDEQGAESTLLSYDSSTGTPVNVLVLRHGATVVRAWSGTSTVGHWFAPTDGGPLPSPATARRISALPAGNTAVNATLALMMPRVWLVTGRCADMTAQPGYGPWATWGGPQLYGPKVSTYPPPVYDPAQATILCDLRWEKAAVDGIDW